MPFSVLAQLSALVDAECLSDVAVMPSDGPPLRCHLLLLYKNSTYFRSKIIAAFDNHRRRGGHSGESIMRRTMRGRRGILLFENEMLHAELVIVIHFLYTGKLPNQLEMEVQLGGTQQSTPLQHELLTSVALHARRMGLGKLRRQCYRLLPPSSSISSSSTLSFSSSSISTSMTVLCDSTDSRDEWSDDAEVKSLLDYSDCFSLRALSDVVLVVVPSPDNPSTGNLTSMSTLSIHLHSCVLGLRSPYFRALFGLSTSCFEPQPQWIDSGQRVRSVCSLILFV